ncbi:MAG TPA: YdeI/OmpD-associated family protein [Longimicrobium sp.]|nr:YdeI/OmpD-associated family protein [Longimicrobium sp.]HSU16543.1 YdeI/OmpD-associated family protein [Longimicrobium sp.]
MNRPNAKAPAPSQAPEPVFFATPEEFRAWLEMHHQDAAELLVGFWKKGTGKPSLTWPESVDEALSFGWIDGVRRSLGGEAYTIRFTPRKARSTWSAVNVRRAAELIAEGRMRPAGLKAFEARSADKTAIYAYEQRHDDLAEPYAGELRANAKAWEFWRSQPPWYRKTASWWVASAKKEETRRKRLAALIEHSANHRPIPQLDRNPKP